VVGGGDEAFIGGGVDAAVLGLGDQLLEGLVLAGAYHDIEAGGELLAQDPLQ
jgi:hypothetical protein